jgi:hypothetical protein
MHPVKELKPITANEIIDLDKKLKNIDFEEELRENQTL